MKSFFYTLLFLFVLVNIQPLYGQAIKGKITDSNGQPIPFATVYIKELTKGLTANKDGDFDLKIPEGQYSVIISALGYKPENRQIKISNATIETNFILTKHTYKIKEIRIYSDSEDPAYGIMRKAIGLAPYYLNQIKHYSAEVYMKGSIIVLKIPKLLQKAIKVEANENEIEIGRNYVEESLNEIIFDAPDKYNQRVISSNTSFPGDNEVDAMSFVKSSFYQPTVDMAISPLAPNAFSHYRFTFEGVSYEGNFAINKIKVTPRRKSQQLFTGYLYIVDDYWNIHSADLTVNLFIGPIRIKQLYTPVKDDAWLPVSYNMNVKASIIGIKANVSYVSSVRYSNIEINQDITPPLALQKTIKKPVTLVNEKPEPTQDKKTTEKIEKILNKDDMSNRDMIKLVRLMDKETKKEKPEDKSLEIKETTNYTIEEDAKKNDSTYWNKIRPIPLTENELIGYKVRDSVLLAKSDTTIGADTLKKQKNRIIKFAGNLFSGKTFLSKDSSLVFRYDGLIGLDKLSFNTIDGWAYKQEFSLKKVFSPGRELSINPEIGYAFNREAFVWNIHNSFSYAPLKRASFFFDLGQISSDFNPKYGINRSLNSISSLFFRYNYLRLYEESYLKTGNNIDLTNGLRLSTSIKYAERKHLENSTDYSFFFVDDRDYEDNRPENIHLTNYPLDDQESFVIQLGLSYTPGYYYRIKNGVKNMVSSDYPTFSIEYQKGITGVFNDRADFDFFEAQISQSKDLGIFSNLDWNLGAGVFITKKNLHFTDFKHFNTQGIPLLLDRPKNAFMLLEYYQYSTPEWFAEAHIKYSTPFLLIKLLPFFSEKLWRETLYGSYLYQPEFKNYVELGYGLTDVYFIADAGIFVGFEDGKYGRWGFKVSL
ncbi:MAG: carboxypeptidase-like regulatory domain-containing protein, partial [Bacteroidetes bacterium]|nr:carboxypeptidase-like regulatory domain-containing protein [Bacteroidota bacterium]